MILWLSAAWAIDPVAAQTRADAAIRVLQQVRVAQQGGTATAEDVYIWSLRVLQAERDLGRTTAERDHLSRMNALNTAVQDLAAHGLVAALEVDQAAFYVAEAELMFDAGVRGRAPITGPVAPPATAPAPPSAAPPTPAPSADIEACFEACDADFQRCSTTAEHFRLGVGDLDGSDGACVQAAEKKCGTARSQTATDCREQANRACQAEKRSAACAAAQTKCNARCR
ncbi:MAG: hypothetical protein H6738_24450 [Alphaproteobacteria bacterium]|nr:hypothetical protein [Alphaproteobacteria bacterium]MCB9699961.1 hypothetical protein [Alphaproteobacteria bacterium]